MAEYHERKHISAQMMQKLSKRGCKNVMILLKHKKQIYVCDFNFFFSFSFQKTKLQMT